MKQFLLLCSLLISIVSFSQSRPKLATGATGINMQELQKLASMTPDQQQAYKQKMLKSLEGQLVQKSKALNIKIDQTTLPTTTLKLPVKDIKRLATIPSTPLTITQLVSKTAKMEASLAALLPKATVQKIETFTATKSEKEIQSAAIGGWYGADQQAALLLNMKAATKSPDNIVGWNNLAAMLNLTGMQEHAAAILQQCLQQKPNNPMLLNNMGQAYMGLGDLSTAKQFFQQCLTADELHPEANHSMALISLYEQDAEKALAYFEKEMQVAMRRSSLAQVVKSGHRDRINLASLRKQKMNYDGTDKRNFFEEVKLGNFSVPKPPADSRSSAQWKEDNKNYMASLVQEQLFWMNLSHPTTEQLKAEGKLNPGFYTDLVNELIADLGKKYSHLLGVVDEDDVPYLTGIVNDYAKRDNETVCPSMPNTPGGGAELIAAYEQKCCDIKTPLIDNYMQTYNAFIEKKIRNAESNYKQYINGLISVCQLDPSPANRRLVYAAVADYFGFLTTATQSYKVLDPYMACHTGMTTKQADELIASARSIDIQCPSWLKLKLSLKVAKLSADCDGFNIEADVYDILQVGAEKKFTTGTSTLYVGAGIDGSFKGVSSGSISQQFYVVFDHNNQFSDLGMRGSASGELGGGMVGVDVGYDFAMNAGFNAQVEAKSEWITKWEKAITYIPK